MSTVQQQVLTALELISSQQADMGKLLIVLSREQERTSKGLASSTEALLKMSKQQEEQVSFQSQTFQALNVSTEALLKMSAVQAEQAELVKNLCSHQDSTSQQLLAMQKLMTVILEELQKPHEPTDTLAQLKQLLKPLVESLDKLSEKLPEPPTT